MSKSTIKTIIVSLILIVMSVTAFGLMVYQVIKQGDMLATQINALEKEQAQEESHLKLKRTAENTTSERAELQSHFLSQESDSIDFLNQVEAMAPEIGVQLKTSGLDTVIDDSDGTKWIQAKFSFSGSREKVQQFIQILETFPLVSRIMQVDMSAQSSTTWQAGITMQVQVLKYDK